MYYHILIEFTSLGKQRSAYITDITESDLYKKFIIPFNAGKMFFVQGNIVKTNSIKRFRILCSEDKISDIIKRKNDGIPKDILLFYTEEDLLKDPSHELEDITYEATNRVKK